MAIERCARPALRVINRRADASARRSQNYRQGFGNVIIIVIRALSTGVWHKLYAAAPARSKRSRLLRAI